MEVYLFATQSGNGKLKCLYIPYRQVCEEMNLKFLNKEEESLIIEEDFENFDHSFHPELSEDLTYWSGLVNARNDNALLSLLFPGKIPEWWNNCLYDEVNVDRIEVVPKYEQIKKQSYLGEAPIHIISSLLYLN